MGRKNHHALIENQKAKKGKPESASKLNRVKKDKNAFKVTSQNKVKKARQVQKQVQNVSYSGPTTKTYKLDNNHGISSPPG